MKRVIVIGSPGAGKSTFARKLKDKTGLPLYYLDRIFHKPDGTTFTRKEFDQKLQTIMQTDRWIIDGNYQRTDQLPGIYELIEQYQDSRRIIFFHSRENADNWIDLEQ